MIPPDDKRVLTRNHSLIQGKKKGEMEPTRSVPSKQEERSPKNSSKKFLLMSHRAKFSHVATPRQMESWEIAIHCLLNFLTRGKLEMNFVSDHVYIDHTLSPPFICKVSECLQARYGTSCNTFRPLRFKTLHVPELFGYLAFALS